MSSMSFIEEKSKCLPYLSRPKLYFGLILAFFIKSIGAAWDVSYHFKHFREFYQLPHIVNALGDVILLFLLFYLWFRGTQKIQRELRIILYGILIFIGGIIFDQWYHEKFGVDLTIWSPAHFVLYAGSLISLIGSFLYVLRDWPESRMSLSMKKISGILFSVLILDVFWFMLLQHEQGVVMDYALKQGIRLADADLIEIFFRTQKDVYSNLPLWLYGAWAIFSAVLVFQFVKRMNLHKYGATLVASIYLTERFILNTVFDSINYPTSALPFYLIIIAFIFDVLYNKLAKKSLVRDIATSVVPIVVIILLGFIKTDPPFHPPIVVFQTFLAAIPAAILGYIFIQLYFHLFFISSYQNPATGPE